MNFDMLRKLARSIKYQNLYSRAKELNGIRLFNNESDLSYIQSIFLYYLELYNGLYISLSSDEKNLSEEVIEDWIRTESYLFWRQKNNKIKPGKEKQVSTNSDNAVVFKRT